MDHNSLRKKCFPFHSEIIWVSHFSLKYTMSCLNLYQLIYIMTEYSFLMNKLSNIVRLCIYIHEITKI